MLHHVSLGVRDVERAARFYDAVLGALGYSRVMEFLPHAVAYGEDAPVFWIQLPHNQQIATAGNGVHISFIAPSQEAVDAFHAAALDCGAQTAGGPGPRPDYSPDYYGAFVYDLDGNKLEATLLALPEAVKERPAPAKKPARKAAKKTVKKKAAKKTAKPAAAKRAKTVKKKTAKNIIKKAAVKTVPVKAAATEPLPSKKDKKDKGGKKDKKDKKNKKHKKDKT